MPPSFSSSNVANIGNRESKFTSQTWCRLAVFTLATHASYIFFCYPCLMMGDTPNLNPSSFFITVIVVVFFCSDKKMIRIAAPRIVTFVKHAKTFWNWTVFNLPNKSMGVVIFPPVHENSMPKMSNSTSPLPATVKSFTVDLKPKPKIDVLFSEKIKLIWPHTVLNYV